MSDHGHHTDRRKSARGNERRKKNREVISAPVRVRGMVGPDRKFDETTTTINLSPTGILIETSSDAYYRAMRVSVTVPYDDSTSVAHAEQEGRVVRIGESHKGRRTVAIALAHAEETTHPAKSCAGACARRKNRTPLKIGPVAGRRGGRSGRAKPEKTGPLQPATSVTNIPARRQFSKFPRPACRSFWWLNPKCSASEFMKSYLTTEGYEVITVRTSAEAHLILEQRIPSLLIAAVEGEDMPGYSLCSHFKQTPRLKPVPVMLDDQLSVSERLRQSAFHRCRSLYGQALQTRTPRPRGSAVRTAAECESGCGASTRRGSLPPRRRKIHAGSSAYAVEKVSSAKHLRPLELLQQARDFARAIFPARSGKPRSPLARNFAARNREPRHTVPCLGAHRCRSVLLSICSLMPVGSAGSGGQPWRHFTGSWLWR